MLRELCVGAAAAVASLLVGALSGGASSSAAEQAQGPLVLSGATLIDGTGGGPRTASLVVVEAGRITRIGRIGEIEVSPQATVLDLSGQYLLPGFIDTHFHVDVPPEAEQGLLRQALAYGITTIRDPAPGGRGVGVRDAIANGSLVGPRMFTAGPLIDGPGSVFADSLQPVTEEEIRQEVRRQAATGVDSIKLYMYVRPELVRAAIDEAHGLGLSVIGHLKRTGWAEAARSGIDTLVHFGSEGPIWELLEPEEREVFARLDWPDYLRRWAIRSGDVALDGSRMAELTRALVEEGVEVNPTLVILEALYWGNDREALARFEPERASEADKALWGQGWEQGNPFMRRWGLSAEDYRLAQRAFSHAQKMIRRLHEHGVLVTAGSDVSMPWITPGVSFHRELELLVEVGVPERHVLQIATLNGAKALDIASETGTVEEGKSADLVVLARNPLENIRNTRSIRRVVLRGRVVERGVGTER